MSKLSNYTSVFRVRLDDALTASAQNQNQTAAASNSAGPPIRRSHPWAKPRPVVSCLPCRSRKHKCDRLLPCGTCSRRGEGALCRYISDGAVSSGGRGSQRAAAAAAAAVAAAVAAAPAPGWKRPARAISDRASSDRASSDRSPAGAEQDSVHTRELSTPRDDVETPSTSVSVASAAGNARDGVCHEAQVRLQKLEEVVNRMITVPKPTEGAAAHVSANAEAAKARRKDVNTRPSPVAFGDPEPGGSSSAPDARYEWIMPIGVGSAQPSPTGRVASSSSSAGGEAPSVRATNWAAVLDSIRDIQSYLGETPAGDDVDDVDDVDNVDDVDDVDDADDVNNADDADDDIDTSLQSQLANPNLNQLHLASLDNGTFPPVSPNRGVSGGISTTPSLLESVEADGIFAAVAATPALADSSPSNPPSTSAMAQNPRMPKHMAEAVSCLPDRPDCDRLLAVYFQSSYITGPFVHMDEFQRAYSRFWRTGNPASANAASPLLWVSMLASVLCIGAMISGGRQLSWMAERDRNASNVAQGAPTKGEPRNQDLIQADRLAKLSTRCLLAGDYLSGRTLALEALLLNAHVRLMQKRDHNATLWATVGVAVRLAQRMGYQQVDAPTGAAAYGVGGKMLTPFEKEMRRRAWYFVESFDMLYSFQCGMPTMIHEDETCTDPPSNLRDDDFDQNSAELPPSRPVSDYTPALYFSVKLNLVRLLRKVLRFTVWRSDRLKRSDGAANKATVVGLADELKKAYAAVPLRLRMPTHIRDCPFTDASHDIMHRLSIELLSHKATCILFRASLSRDLSRIEADGDGGVDASGFTAAEARAQRQLCLVSALRILDLHTEFEYETRPSSLSLSSSSSSSSSSGSPPDDLENSKGGGTASRGAGRLASDRHILSTLAVHDFLLAATIVCLDLIEEGRSKTGTHMSTSTSTSMHTSTRDSHLRGEPSLEERAADRGAKLDALRRAYALWHEQRTTSRDAAHAARVLGAIVTKLSSEGGGGGGGAAGRHREQREQTVPEMRRRERAQRAGDAGDAGDAGQSEQAATIASGGASDQTDQSTSVLHNIPLSYVNSQDLQHISDMPIEPAMTQPPPAHLNYAYEWAEPGPFGAALNDPMNVDWNMVDAFLLDRELDTEVGGNVWSADLMALEN